MGSPPSWISSPSTLLSSAAAISFSPSSFSTSQPLTVSGRIVEPIVPSSETRIAPWGLTFSTCSASAKKAFMRSVAARLCAPASSFQTTLISWPE